MAVQKVDGLTGDDPELPKAVAMRDFCVAHGSSLALFKRGTSVFALATRAVDCEGPANLVVVFLVAFGGNRPQPGGAGMSGASSSGGANPVERDPSGATLSGAFRETAEHPQKKRKNYNKHDKKNKLNHKPDHRTNTKNEQSTTTNPNMHNNDNDDTNGNSTIDTTNRNENSNGEASRARGDGVCGGHARCGSQGGPCSFPCGVFDDFEDIRAPAGECSAGVATAVLTSAADAVPAPPLPGGRRAVLTPHPQAGRSLVFHLGLRTEPVGKTGVWGWSGDRARARAVATTSFVLKDHPSRSSAAAVGPRRFLEAWRARTTAAKVRGPRYFVLSGHMAGTEGRGRGVGGSIGMTGTVPPRHGAPRADGVYFAERPAA